jgi:hypothetical protein
MEVRLSSCHRSSAATEKKISLKITIHEEPTMVTMRLDGSVTGPWVSEVQRAWQTVAVTRGSRKVTIDLREVIHMNRDGQKLLAEIHKVSGAEFIADSPMTKYFAEEAQRAYRIRDEREEK